VIVRDEERQWKKRLKLKKVENQALKNISSRMKRTLEVRNDEIESLKRRCKESEVRERDVRTQRSQAMKARKEMKKLTDMKMAEHKKKVLKVNSTEIQQLKNIKRRMEKTLQVRNEEIEGLKGTCRQAEMRERKLKAQRLQAIKLRNEMKKSMQGAEGKLKRLCARVKEVFEEMKRETSQAEKCKEKCHILENTIER